MKTALRTKVHGAILGDNLRKISLPEPVAAALKNSIQSNRAVGSVQWMILYSMTSLTHSIYVYVYSGWSPVQWRVE